MQKRRGREDRGGTERMRHFIFTLLFALSLFFTAYDYLSSAILNAFVHSVLRDNTLGYYEIRDFYFDEEKV